MPVQNVRQTHHGIPWNNRSFKFQNHPLVKKARVNLEKYAKNLEDLTGHAGRHSKEYLQSIRDRLDKAYLMVKGLGKAAAKKQLDKVISGIWRDIKSGKLAPYNPKDVIF